MTQAGFTLRFGRWLSLAFMIACLALALGHALVRRGAQPYRDDDMTTEEI